MTAFRKYELYCKPSKVGEGRYGEHTISTPDDVYEVCKMLKLQEMSREKVYTLYVDTAGHLIGVVESSSGSLDASIIDPKVIYGPALVMGKCAAIILVHNHPSGKVSPSQEDKEVTKRVKDAGELLGVKMLDHVIVGDGAWHSFNQSGELYGQEKIWTK